MKVGTKISEFRKKMNLTQEALASKMGVSRQTIASWENDLTSPNLEDAVKLAGIFKIKMDDFVDNALSVECKSNYDGILNSLIGKDVYLDVDCDDYTLSPSTKCKIISIDENYIKFEFKNGKQTITKLMDIDLVYSFKLVSKKVK